MTGPWLADHFHGLRMVASPVPGSTAGSLAWLVPEPGAGRVRVITDGLPGWKIR
jgi:hypothetical protein